MGPKEAFRRDILIRDAFVAAKRTIPEDTIFTTFKIKTNGKILELNFSVSEKSELSIDDIALIEKTLKKKFMVKMNAEEFRGMKSAWYSAPIFLSALKGL